MNLSNENEDKKEKNNFENQRELYVFNFVLHSKDKVSNDEGTKINLELLKNQLLITKNLRKITSMVS